MYRVRMLWLDLCWWCCRIHRGSVQDGTVAAAASHQGPCEHCVGSPSPASATRFKLRFTIIFTCMKSLYAAALRIKEWTNITSIIIFGPGAPYNSHGYVQSKGRFVGMLLNASIEHREAFCNRAAQISRTWPKLWIKERGIVIPFSVAPCCLVKNYRA